jgi:hypothetical protein
MSVAPACTRPNPAHSSAAPYSLPIAGASSLRCEQTNAGVCGENHNRTRSRSEACVNLRVAFPFSASDFLAQLRAEFLRAAHGGRSASRVITHVHFGCAPFGFRHPRKDFKLSQHRLEKSCRPPRKSTPCACEQQPTRFLGCPREQGKKRRLIA